MTEEQNASLRAFRQGYEGDGVWWKSEDLDSELRDAHMGLRNARSEWNNERPCWKGDWTGDAVDFKDPWFAEARTIWKADQDRFSYLSDRRK